MASDTETLDTSESDQLLQSEPESDDNILTELNAMFKKTMLEKREKIVSLIQNAPELARKLMESKVFTADEKIAIVSEPIRKHQKEDLFDVLVTKSFGEIDCIINALEITDNEDLPLTLRLIRITLLKRYPNFNCEKYIRNVPHEGQGKDCSGSRRHTSYGIDDESENFAIDSVSNDEDPSTQDTENTPKDEDTFMSGNNLHIAARNGNTGNLKQLLLEFNNSGYQLDDDGRTPLHAAVSAKNSTDALQCVDLIVTRFKELVKGDDHRKIKEKKLLNRQDKDGITVMHLAAENESVDIVKNLYDKYHCDMLIRDNNGVTPLEIMYMKTPEAIIHFLNEALTVDGGFNLEIDLRTVIGSVDDVDKETNDENHNNSEREIEMQPTGQALPHASDKPKMDKKNHAYSEMEMLAKLIHQNKRGSKIILPHVVIKTFLDQKWKKMGFWLYVSIIFQICLYLWYTLFVVEVFLVKCPYPVIDGQNSSKVVLENSSTNANAKEEDAEASERTLITYLFGDLNAVLQAFTFFPQTDKKVCDLNPMLKFQACVFLIAGIVFFIKEMYEFKLVKNIFCGKSTKKNQDDNQEQSKPWQKLLYRVVELCSNFLYGLLAYLKSLENVFQLIIIALMILVSTLAFNTNIANIHYTSAALSVIVAWALILMQVGNISGHGIYIQILGKVIKSFVTLMGTFLLLIIAFSIAFSIMFPKEKSFETFPKAFSRVIIMMTGELEYDDTFYKEEDPNSGPPIPFMGHIIYTCFTVLLTIILINLLIGMTVSDIQALKSKSEVVLRSIQVDQLYVMETTLIHLVSPLKNIVNRLKMKIIISWFQRKISGNYININTTCPGLDIFVINPEVCNGMVLKMPLKEIQPKSHKEIVTLARSKEEYMEEYIFKYRKTWIIPPAKIVPPVAGQNPPSPTQ